MSNVQAPRGFISAAPYDQSYYQRQKASSITSAEVAVPVILQLTQAASVVDVGCGTGTWLAVFRQHGVRDTLGIDGAYVNREQLHIPSEHFLARDLRQPLRMGRTFGLALSLEVAEHLPPAAAATLVESLVGLSQVVVFSAAAPFQGGTGHVNEQLPEYWAGLFARHGYVAVDALRPLLWNHAGISWFYAQNMIVYVAQGALDAYPALRRAYESTDQQRLNMLHPRIFDHMSLRSATALFLKILGRAGAKWRGRARRLRARA